MIMRVLLRTAAEIPGKKSRSRSKCPSLTQKSSLNHYEPTTCALRRRSMSSWHGSCLSLTCGGRDMKRFGKKTRADTRKRATLILLALSFCGACETMDMDMCPINGPAARLIVPHSDRLEGASGGLGYWWKSTSGWTTHGIETSVWYARAKAGDSVFMGEVVGSLSVLGWDCGVGVAFPFNKTSRFDAAVSPALHLALAMGIFSIRYTWYPVAAELDGAPLHLDAFSISLCFPLEYL